MNIVITGANGLLGRVIGAFLSKTHTVYGIDIKDKGLPSSRFILDREENNPLLKKQFSGAYFKVDLSERSALQDCLEQIPGIDVIIHLAALMEDSSPEAINNANNMGTENIFSVALKLGINKIIYASSIQTVAYRLLNEEPYKSIGNRRYTGEYAHVPKISPTECIPNKLNPSIQAYVESKFRGEALAKSQIENEISTIVMRLGAISVTNLPYNEPALRAIWCSHEDLCGFIEKALIKLQKTQKPFSRNYYVCSKNQRLMVDLANDIGFEPTCDSDELIGQNALVSHSIFLAPQHDEKEKCSLQSHQLNAP